MPRASYLHISGKQSIAGDPDIANLFLELYINFAPTFIFFGLKAA